MSDSGNIKCVATNILGRATSIGQLIIEGTKRHFYQKQRQHIELFQDADSVAAAAAVVAAVNPLVATAAVLMASQQKADALMTSQQTAAVLIASQQKALNAVAAANKNKELLDKSVIISSAGMWLFCFS